MALPRFENVQLGALQPQTSLDKILRVRSESAIGDRNLHVIARFNPSVTDSDNPPQPKEAVETISVPVVHPISCAFFPRFQRRRRRKRTTAKPGLLEQPPDSTSLCELDLHADFGIIGPFPITVENVDVHLSSTSVGLIGGSLQPGDGLLPDVWSPDDTFAASWLLSVNAAELDSTASPGAVHVSWKRSDESPLATTKIPLPLLKPPINEPAVLAEHPTKARLGEPIEVTYSVLNESPTNMMRLSIQVDSSDFWVMSGTRRIDKLHVLPKEEKVLRYQLIAHGSTGELALPRFHAFEQLRTAPFTGEEEVSVRGRREMPVFREAAGLDASDGLDEPLTVLIVP